MPVGLREPKVFPYFKRHEKDRAKPCCIHMQKHFRMNYSLDSFSKILKNGSQYESKNFLRLTGNWSHFL